MTAVGSEDSPSDEVLLELGRLVWAARTLEEDTYTVCRAVEPRGGPFDDDPVGRRIREALTDLKKRPNDELRATADKWLREARDALEERNGVVHSTHLVWVWAAPGEPTEPSPADRLVHFPRNRNKPRVETPLTVEALGRIRRRLERAVEGSDQLPGLLWESRPKT
jgi:hypothetical protein